VIVARRGWRWVFRGLGQERQRVGPVIHEREHRREFADPKNLVDILVDLAEDHPASMLTCQTMQGQEPSQRRGAREHDAVEVDDQVRLPFRPDVRLVMLAEVTNRCRVKSQAIPEFGDEDTALVPNLDHGFKHERPVRAKAEIEMRETRGNAGRRESGHSPDASVKANLEETGGPVFRFALERF
jgi:hypothetical protein